MYSLSNIVLAFGVLAMLDGVVGMIFPSFWKSFLMKIVKAKESSLQFLGVGMVLLGLGFAFLLRTSGVGTPEIIIGIMAGGALVKGIMMMQPAAARSVCRIYVTKPEEWLRLLGLFAFLVGAAIVYAVQ